MAGSALDDPAVTAKGASEQASALRAAGTIKHSVCKWCHPDLSVDELEIGAIAKPDFIQFAPGLPKTRSGKKMCRILRKIAANEYQDLGDTSTLAEPWGRRARKPSSE